MDVVVGGGVVVVVIVVLEAVFRARRFRINRSVSSRAVNASGSGPLHGLVNTDCSILVSNSFDFCCAMHNNKLDRKKSCASGDFWIPSVKDEMRSARLARI